MARAGLVQIADALASQLRIAYTAVTDIDVQVEGRLLVNPTPPAIDVYPGDLHRDRESAAFDDISGGYRFTVRARVSTADTTAGQDLLLAFMDDTDPLCMAAALAQNPTLGGVASSVSVEEPTGYVMYPDAGGEGALLGCQWPVLVLPGESVVDVPDEETDPPPGADPEDPEAPEMIFEDDFASESFAAWLGGNGGRAAACDATLICPGGTPDPDDPLDSYQPEDSGFLWRVTLRYEAMSTNASCNNACELVKSWPNYKLGETEYFAYRLRINEPYTPIVGFCMLCQPNYGQVKYDGLGLNLLGDQVYLSAHLGYSGTTAQGHYANAQAYQINSSDGISFDADPGEYHDVIMKVTYSMRYGTDATSPVPGVLRVYNRKPETTSEWATLHDSTLAYPFGIPTRQWGYGIGNDVTMLVDSQGLNVAGGTPRVNADKIGAYRLRAGNPDDLTVDHRRFGIAASFANAEAYLDLAD